jgi:hypothetical protein
MANGRFPPAKTPKKPTALSSAEHRMLSENGVVFSFQTTF